jgi:hypothetical protein
LLHFFSNSNYGLHRDEYLCLDEANHLGWGFLEVPPITPLIGKISLMFGSEPFFIRFFPAICGVLTLWLICKMVQEMGGKFWAILLAGLAYIFAPAFLRSCTFLMPVCFNQFWWTLSAFLMIKITKNNIPKYWYLLGIVGGLAFQTKYSIVFFYVAIFGGLLMTSHRKLLFIKYPWIALGIALGIAFRNLLWQHTHGWPVIHHMADLAETQLVNVSAFNFIFDQLWVHGASILVWLPGLIWLFWKGKKFRFLGWTFVFTIGILVLLSGKSYYSFGAYPMLMSAGGIFWERLFLGKPIGLKVGVLVTMLFPNFFLLPMGLPILKIENVPAYCGKLAELGIEQRWEDGVVYQIPQDYADMHGWLELPEKVAKIYHALPPEKQKRTQIWGGHYGQAGVLNLFREKYNLPECVSMNASYPMWMPDSVDFDYQILVDDSYYLESSWFSTHTLIDSIQNPYARDVGCVYWRENPRMDMDSLWRTMLKEKRFWESD